MTEKGDDEACSGGGAFFTDGKSSHGNSGGHLGDGEKGVEPTKRFAGHGNP